MVQSSPAKAGRHFCSRDGQSGKDLVFLAHVGFEGSASILDLINGSWLQQKVLLKFWRIPYEKVPKHDFENFLFGEWDEMNRTVDELTKQLSTKG